LKKKNTERKENKNKKYFTSPVSVQKCAYTVSALLQLILTFNFPLMRKKEKKEKKGNGFYTLESELVMKTAT